jgi:type I restriction enzyme M protein
MRVRIGNSDLFDVRAGKRMRTQDILANPGTIPVYSCFRNAALKKGDVSEEWLSDNGIPIENGPIVAVNANGASVGMVFVRRDRCALTDDVIAIEVLDESLSPDYVAAALRTSIAAGNFEYEANTRSP